MTPAAAAVRTGPERISLDALAAAFQPGERIFLPGASSEATPLLAALANHAGRTRDLQLTSSMVPGISAIDPALMQSDAQLTGLFMHANLRAAHRDGRYHHLPISYSGFVRLIRERLEFDTCVVQVSPSDRRGRCSLGVGVEFTLEALARSRRVVGIVNPSMPAMPMAPSLAFDDFALVAEAEFPLRSYDTGPIDAASAAIATTVAGFIDDGAALQVGLGKVPAALMTMLRDRRGLRLQSGMLSDGVMALAEAGALDPAWPHAACVLAGSQKLFDWAGTRRDIHLRGCGQTHDPAQLMRVDRLVAVNSALEIDLFGQCNLEIAGGKAVSGAGGAPDFAFSASHAPGGTSIVALPSTFGKAAGSRVVPRLGNGALTTLPRTDVDVVITEHGAADLRPLSVHARAEALIELAAPAHRNHLRTAWRDMASSAAPLT